MARDLDASRREDKPNNLTCSLGGETFRCVPTLAFAALIDLAEGGIGRLPFWQFLHAAIDDRDIPKLEATLRRKNNPVSDDEVFDAVNELVEAYTGRPTGRPAELPGGPRKTGRKSKAGSSSPEGSESAA